MQVHASDNLAIDPHGNSGTHTVKLVDASSGTDVAGGSVGSTIATHEYDAAGRRVVKAVYGQSSWIEVSSGGHMYVGLDLKYVVVQTRTHNAANETTAVSGDWIDPTYDAAGNMVSGPKTGDEDQTRLWFVYDAWNRMVDSI